ncbi:hypothetical protein ON010_g6770 [Phytophthora cinnamomi]|nr:hypothetical protein ON010_g6770 [Phytophthora cinnamomi]
MKPLESNYHEFHVVGGDVQRKLALTFPSDSRAGCCKLSLRCCDLKTLIKRASVLLVFHLLNVLVAIGGIAGVIFLLTGFALNLLWVVGILLVAIAAIPCARLEQLPARLSCLKLLGYVVTATVYLALFVAFCAYTYVGPSVIVLGGIVGLALVYLSLWSIQAMVKADARLSNSVAFAIPSSFSVSDPLPDECADQFHVEFSSSDTGSYFPIFEMTSRIWIIVLYFALPKLIVGALSAVAIFLTVIQPAIALVSGGDAPFFTSWMTFHENPIVYSVVMCLISVAGAVGLVMVAALSAQLTSRVFGEQKTKTGQGENELEAATG